MWFGDGVTMENNHTSIQKEDLRNGIYDELS